MEIINSLERILKESDSLPFLFVGSGFSKRYLDLPNWEDLLKEISKLVSEKPYYFDGLKSTLRQNGYSKEKNYNENL